MQVKNSKIKSLSRSFLVPGRGWHSAAKRVFSALLGIFVLISASPAVFAAGEADFSSPGYIVRIKPGTESVSALSGCELIGGDFYFVPSARSVASLAAEGVLISCEENRPLELQDYSEGYEPEYWHLRSIGASAAWAHKNASGEADRMGDGVTIAVVDSGVMANHPDFENAHILEPIILSSDEDGIDDYHGTFIAGMLAASVNNGIGVDGIVPNVNILPICVTSNGGKTDIKTASEGIYTAVEKGADVIIFSIGGTSGDNTLREACDYANDSGVIFVTCAGNYSGGNNRSSNNYMYPAAYDSTVAVSACKLFAGEPVFDESYSYFNDAVTVSAPGTSIVSLYLDGGTTTQMGTSFAAPIVAGMAAMAKQAIPDIKKDGFVDLLKASSVDLGEEGYDVKYGHGYVSIPAFMTALDEAVAALASKPGEESTAEGSENASETGSAEGEGGGENSASGEGGSESPDGGEPESGASLPPSPEAPESGGSSGSSSSSGGSGGSGDSGSSGGSDDSGGSGDSGDSGASGGGSGGGNNVEPPENDPSEPEPAEEAPAEPLEYSDVNEETWGYEGIRYATAHGLMNGVGDGLFAPERDVSRAMLVTVLWRLSGEPMVESEPGFTDAVPGEWYDMAVRWAVSEGIVNGYGDGRFGPSDGIKREQFALILFRYARYAGVLTAPDSPAAELPDMTGVSDWALEAVGWAFGKGLLADLAGGDFIPSLVSNRAETAMILTHYCKNLA